MTESVDFQIGLFAAILLVGVGQGLFLAIAVLFASERTSRANTFLAGLLFAFVLELANRFAMVTGLIEVLPGVLAMNWSLDFFFGPLVYLYARELTSLSETSSNRAVRRHMMLPIAGLFVAALLWISFPGEQFIATLDASADPPLAISEAVLALASMASMIAYVWTSFRLLKKHRANVETNFSYLDRTSLAWLRNLLMVIAVLLVLYVVFAFTEFQFHGLERIFPLAIVVGVFCIGFFGIRQPIVFERRGTGEAEFLPADSGDSPSTEPSKDKYRKSALSEEDSRAIFAEIESLMTGECVYRTSDLSLPMLSDRLGLPSHYVSQAINQGSGSNFFDFINKRRVSFVKEKLRAAGQTGAINVLQTAFDAGFNSKSAFYTSFKSETGMTPTAYQKNARSGAVTS